ncbi:MAG: hypothetical protein ACRYHQ_25135 [Janthinobacterium lividum]
MPEGGFFRKILAGGDEEAAEPEAPPPGADPVAVGIAVDGARFDPALSAEAAIYLRKQAHFVAIQSEHLHEQRAIQLSHLKVRRFSDRLRVATQLFVFMVVAFIGLGVAVMVYDAFTAQSVIVDIFDTPPILAADGLSGQVVAGLVLDELTRLEASTHTTTIKRNLTSAWTNDITVEVPETGVSLGELDRILKSRFGHDLHIGGSLMRSTNGGLTLAVRGAGIAARTFTGGAGDIGRLTTDAAEYIYGESQPPLYAEYLTSNGRADEAIAFSKSKLSDASGMDRSFLLFDWATGLGQNNQSPDFQNELFRKSLELEPTRWAAYEDIAANQIELGDEEGAWRTMEVMQKLAGGRPGKAPESDFSNLDYLVWNLPAERTANSADSNAALDLTALGSVVADVDIRMHDPADARLQLATTKTRAWDPSLDFITHFTAGFQALESGDGPRAATEMEAVGKALSNPLIVANYASYGCWIAPAEELAGHYALADAAIAAGGHFVDCARFHADILDGRGDWSGAQKAYAAAVAIAPDLPAGYYSWGLALARHGNLDGAIAKLAAANTCGPGWADPLKAWGDVLARQAHWKAALTKYDQALPLAPAWDDLHKARDAAAAKI